MRLAVVGWAADSGVGRELIDAVRHLPVTSAFIMQNAAKPTRKDLMTEIPTFFSDPTNLDGQMHLFLECHKPDVILTWEIPGHWGFPVIWQRRHIKWVHMVHWDWFPVASDYMRHWKSAKLLSPNVMCQRLLRHHHGLDSTLIPVPVDVKRLAFVERKRADLFTSVYGYGGARDRRSLPEIFAAWRGMSNPPDLLLRAQCNPTELKTNTVPRGIHIDIGNTTEPGGLYAKGDLALQPSRYEGVGVSMLEAQACGMPVIALDAPPMNEIAPDLAVPLERTIKIPIMGKPLDSHIPSVAGLKAVVERIRGRDIRALSRKVRQRVERQFSWDALRERWIKVLKS